jgi:FkbM family methyltransferase
MSSIRRLVRRILPGRSQPDPRAAFGTLSYSQEGEDRIIATVLGMPPQGFYVDVGAHHPQRFSNTYAFYRRGWRGINIEARPGAMVEFQRLRPRDINVEAAISATPQSLTYFEFDEPALNTFSEETAERMLQLKAYKVVNRRSITTRTLASILDEYLPLNQRIDFLTVDVEGLDEQVLLSNNWDKYRPRVVVAEAHRCWSCATAPTTRVSTLLSQHGYHPVAKTLNTIVFCLEEVRRSDSTYEIPGATQAPALPIAGV